MCGIAGLVDFRGDQDILKRVTEMVSVISHRGPDGEGVVCHENVAIGHRRLAIIDLTDDAAQPMTNWSGDLVLSFNGEIYNYVELRAELTARGRQFRSQSDTEVLLQAYEEWGEECVTKLNGMWSFAIFDKCRNRFFCSRDRFGEKPFYFTQQRDGFYFGSEIRQLLKVCEARTANRNLLNRFLLGVVGEGVGDTFFEGIQKLPAGHNLTYDVTTRGLRISRYFELTFNRDVARAGFGENLERFKYLFEDAVALRMRSDVKVGTCLSGGLDSASIAAYAAEMQRHSASGKFSAITAKSTEAANDESGFAELVVSYNDLKWIISQPTYNDFASTIAAVTRAQEEPFGSASIVMQYHVMKAASQSGIKVLLDGQGGDEVFMGYERYFVAHIRQLFRQLSWGAALSDLRSMGRNNAIMDLSTFLKYLAYFSHAGIRRRRILRRSWFLRDKPEDIAEVRNYARAMRSPFLLQKFELDTANLPPLLRFEDKNSMSHSIETRLPMLDPRLVEFGCSLPVEHKMQDGWSKYILRRGMEGRIPDAVCWRRDKIGFEAPQISWTRMHRANMVSAIEGSILLNEIVDMDGLSERDFEIDRASFWRLYSVAMWERQFSVNCLS